MDCQGIDKKWDAFSEWWNAHTDNVYKLTDCYHPNYYRMARALSPLEPEVRTLNRSGRFDLKLQAMPQKYLMDGDVPRILDNGEKITLRNPTSYDAYPIIVAKIRDDRRHTIAVYDSGGDVVSAIGFKVSDDSYSYYGYDIKYDLKYMRRHVSFLRRLSARTARSLRAFRTNTRRCAFLPA